MKVIFAGCMVAKCPLPFWSDLVDRIRPGLAVEYRTRRNFFIDSLFEAFNVEKSVGTKGVWEGMEVLSFSLKSSDMVEKSKPRKIFNLVPPTSGMFLWVRTTFSHINACASDPEI
jgi:aromatic amino acid aminotransferase I / 2-aminoadipate transaminase